MPIGVPKEITECRRFFREPQHSKQRQYEALRRYFVDERSSKEVAAEFGYTEGSFRVLCHHFRRDPEPAFFLTPVRGPQSQPKKSAARVTIELLRKRNHSVYEIAEALKEQGTPLSATAVCEVLRELGFAALPRRLDEERPELPRPTVESVADARTFNLAPRRFPTRCGGLFLFLPDLVRLGIAPMADTARLPGSKMIPRAHALRACLALKLWAIERKSHVMALVADEGKVTLAGCRLRQLYILDLGHDKPTVLLTNDTRTPKTLITRYAQRMLIENAICDAVRFFHIDALSSAVAMKVDFDMTLLVIASGLYRRLAQRMRGYAECQARQVFRDLVDMPADVTITEGEVQVRFHRRAHLPIIAASGLLDEPVAVPWWNGMSLRMEV